MIEQVRLIVEILIAAGAIGAAVYAGKTYKHARRTFHQTRQFRKEEQESRRAMLTPGPDTGHLKIGSTQSEHELEITLVNYGSNPTGIINCSVVIYDRNIRTRTYMGAVTSINPIAHGQPWHLILSNLEIAPHHIQQGPELVRSGLVRFVILMIEYKDTILNKTFEGKFFWMRDSDGKLVEPGSFSYDRLDAIEENERELWKSSGLAA